MRFLDKLFGRLERRYVDPTHDYFWDAIRVYSTNRDPTIGMAALAAAKKAARDKRALMVKYLREFAAGEDEVEDLLNDLADEITLQDWTIKDAVDQGLALSKVDEEYAIALDKFDSAVFRRRFPDLFN